MYFLRSIKWDFKRSCLRCVEFDAFVCAYGVVWCMPNIKVAADGNGSSAAMMVADGRTTETSS